jgi:hypothetical protein
MQMIPRAESYCFQDFHFLGKEEEYRVKLQILKKVQTYYGTLPRQKNSNQNPEEKSWRPWEQ